MEDYGLDRLDLDILHLLEEDSTRTPKDLQEIIEKPLNVIEARMIKMMRRGFLSTTYGIDFQIVDLQIETFCLYSTNSERLIKRSQVCPFILNCFAKTGSYNFLLFAVTSTLSKENKHFTFENCLRQDRSIRIIEHDYITSIQKSCILPTDLTFLLIERVGCNRQCPFNRPTLIVRNRTAPSRSLEEEAKIHRE
jgi:DNA-binding Lrp family transcriptional regulator